MTDLLFEIGCEEIPASYIDPALSSLKENAKKELDKARLGFDGVETLGTPRRLVLIVKNLAHKQDDLVVEVHGPKSEMAFDAEGKLTKQALGFLSAKKIDPKDVFRKSTPKGEVLAAKLFETGRTATELLPSILEKLIVDVPFPKVMKWESSGALFARPVRWLLALYGSEPLRIRFADVQSGCQTTGHRFLSPEWKSISTVQEYLSYMKANFVMLSPDDRRESILSAARELARSQGGGLVEDEALLDIVKNLVEYPWPMVGKFEKRYLDIPREILISEMREHQKYFAIEGNNKELISSFIVVAGSRARNESAVADGHSRVLRARFEDGAFYYDEDLKKPFEQFIDKLHNLQFQRELGSVFEKSARIEKIASFVLDELAASEQAHVNAKRVALLAKADLVSGVVSQFPELQGVMGSYYAKKSGENEAVVLGIKEHYLPRFSKDEVPSTLEGAVVAMADKLDSLVGIIGIGKVPKGNADPFALRRAAIGVARIIIEKGFLLSLSRIVDCAVSAYEGKKLVSAHGLVNETVQFILGRARGLFSAQTTIVDGAMAVSSDDLSDLAARIEAITQLQSKDPSTFEELSSALKRASNIVNKAKTDGILKEGTKLDPRVLSLESERALYSQLEAIRPRLDLLKRNQSPDTLKEHYVDLMRGVAELKPIVDRFFDEVMVMVDDALLRNSRLCLLDELKMVANQIADFTRIQF